MQEILQGFFGFSKETSLPYQKVEKYFVDTGSILQSHYISLQYLQQVREEGWPLSSSLKSQLFLFIIAMALFKNVF